MALAITDQNWEELIKNNKYVVMDFWAEWCGPCRAIGPFVEEAAQEMEGKVLIGKVNIDENPQVAQQYGVMSIPTFIVFKGGEPAGKTLGAQPKENILALL